MNLSPEEKAVGKANFMTAVGSELTRREFIWGSVAAGAVSSAALGGFYFNYGAVKDPVRVGIIGTGDEGSVLINNINPDFLDVVAISDIRPFNRWRAFHGDPKNMDARMGLIRRYGYANEDQARKHVKVYENNYKELLDDPDVEMVIIAVPLHLHAQIAIDAMQKGKHVLTEKLMAHNITQCKDMARAAMSTNKLLAVGHQRHYSILYDNAVNMIRRDLIGKVHHIRAQWHREKDTWSPPLPEELKLSLVKINKELESLDKVSPTRLEDLRVNQTLMEQQVKDATVEAEKYGYESIQFQGRTRSALEELIRWRLWDRTGGGLMAELGSHQLDASSIFISASHPLDAKGKSQKIRPLTVSATGGIHLLDPKQRECEDHVYCTYEFPAEEYHEDPNRKIVVTYSSINGNGFGGYGEVVLGDAGTLILEREQDVMLYKGAQTMTAAGVVADGKTKKPKLESYESSGGPPKAATQLLGDGPVSRGYTEEMEHFAYVLRNNGTLDDLRCNPKVAMADAIIALTPNIAIRQQRRIEFKPEWFEIEEDATPEKDLKGSTVA